MSMREFFCVALVCIFLSNSCNSTRKAISDQQAPNNTLTDFSFRKVMRDQELFASTTELVPLDTIYVHRDTLHLLTKKITGCETENFRLMWNGAWMKSMPPQAPIKLFELLPPDCKEQHNFHLTFNIKPIRLKQDSVTTTNDTIKSIVMLRISGWKSAVKYEY